MNLDMRTVIFSYVVSNAICTGVIALVWQQNRRRWSGLGWWLADFVMQFTALGLVILRGVVPDVVSMVVSNTLVIAGTVLLYEGLSRFAQQRVFQTPNYVLLAVFVAVHTYFTLAQPSLAARDLNFSAGLLVICVQCAGLMLGRAYTAAPAATRWVGLVFAGYGLVSLVRIIVIVSMPRGNDFFSESLFDTVVIIAYQMLFIALTFSLVLLVNRRLVIEVQAWGDALRLSEDKFAKAFHASPDAILITRASDGRLVEVNEGFCRLTGYSREEALNSSTLALHLWANPPERAEYVAAVQANQSVRNAEYDFIVKSGARLTCLCFGETIDLEGEAHLLSVVRDVTERNAMQARLNQQQQATATLAERECLAHELHDNLSQVLAFMNVQAQAAYDWLAAGDSAQAGAHILRLAAAARETHSDMRQFIANSLIVIAPQAGFLPALQQSLAQFEQRHGLHTELTIAADAALAFDPVAEIHLLRIIQEALTNARKHAQVHTVRVSLSADERQVCVLVADDGIGFDAAQVTSAAGRRFGLRIMQARAAELGGAVDIDSTPGQGTQVRVCFPKDLKSA